MKTVELLVGFGEGILHAEDVDFFDGSGGDFY